MINLIGLFLSGALVFGKIDFPEIPLNVGGHKLTVEVATSQQQRSQGLMGRTSLSDKKGMLFIFPDIEPLSFWMKNTKIDLSIGFFDAKGVLFEVQKMFTPSIMESKPKFYVSSKPGRFALEVVQGWFEKRKITENGKVVKKVKIKIPQKFLKN